MHGLTNGQSPLASIARWIAFLPGALLAGKVAYWAVWLAAELTGVANGFDAHKGLHAVWDEGLAGLAFGLAYVHAGSRIAPVRHVQVLYALAIVLIASAGFLSYFAIGLKLWSGLVADAGGIVGAIWACRSIATDEKHSEGDGPPNA